MSKPIIVVGSVNMDMMLRCRHLPVRGETVPCKDFRTAPGGKGANQAVAAARLGATVELVGCVGDDSFGSLAAAGLRAEGVELAHLSVAMGRATGVAVVLVEDSGENSIVFAPGANHALSVEHIDAAAARITAAALLVCQLETPLAAVNRAIDIASAAGVPVLLNPAPVQELPDAMLHKVTLLVLNQGEASALAGRGAARTQDAAASVAALRARGASTVLVTLGSSGVLLSNEQGRSHRPACAARAVDTTGAGDTFVGALAAAWLEGQALQSAIDFAQRAAAFSVERHGAQASMPRRADLVPAGIARGAAP